MLYREVITACSAGHTKHVDTPYVENGSLLMCDQVGYINVEYMKY
jgi:hypothetical protein